MQSKLGELLALNHSEKLKIPLEILFICVLVSHNEVRVGLPIGYANPTFTNGHFEKADRKPLNV